MIVQSSDCSPPKSSFDDAPPIDLVHLSRQTMGDRQLEAELLGLFATQAKAIVKALGGEGRPDSADLLHTLCGSARAVGSWSVAARAEVLELDFRRQGKIGQAGQDGDLALLGSTVERACLAIDELLVGADF